MAEPIAVLYFRYSTAMAKEIEIEIELEKEKNNLLYFYKKLKIDSYLQYIQEHIERYMALFGSYIPLYAI